MTCDMDEFWVFGYGSLMWNPGFVHEERQGARAHGFRRSLCVRSFVHRGTEQTPGLVLGLDRGGSCHGVAFRVSPSAWTQTLDYLRARELVTMVYQERTLRLQLSDGRRVLGVGYVVDRNHRQYAGAITVEEAVQVTAQASGQSGDNRAYVENTVEHLRSMGIRDHWLEHVVKGLNKPTL
ncbi:MULTISPECIES: gamma-glutamylcyclotransferase [Rhizobium/Agrobacterium group]|uniref:gamma-glutamylcyclotransferase n=1 Tax=Rhizobium/Agrobacterium group TaxID=227290 RepID=UPI000B3FCA21|nr:MULTISPECIES: gamma-glutamylcyclotransferase [Rhizobium/Agrobacterium group]MCF1484332.1 gamma-glutamylcyclotransferase [Allorhizobium ampelinum]MVA62767.1 gamma-glutamylcyclotransferase [Agrobacterium vitis]MVA72434.1 gamma-glutamylcyclotransferase [Agrobacterium vitis]NSZ44035.1 gamma-glutamylcyclotransferase [Agrobacterium vitis]NTA27783.1 gamma-glutamylcyclotransferase [Allorhizobium ampelinum]